MKTILKILFITAIMVQTFSCGKEDLSEPPEFYGDRFPSSASSDGMDGADGLTPVCDEATLTWHIGTVDTEIKCVRADGKDGADGGKGDKGDDGTDGLTPVCDETTFTWHIGTVDTEIKCVGADGKDGADGGKGDKGDNGTDGLTPVCDETTLTWHIGTIDTEIKCVGADGTDGTDGKDGTDGADGDKGDDGADGKDGTDGADGDKGDDGADGKDGESCSVADDPDNSAYLVMTCVDTEVKWAKAMCGATAYNPDTHVCKKGALMPKCGDEVYNPSTHFCFDDVIYAKCGGMVYAPSTHFCDNRDEQIYKWVKIGTQTWMAENLNYNVSGSVCYGNNPSNCDIYGRLYNWATAMDLPASCNSSICAGSVSDKHRGVCPDGWHLPSRVEWTVLTDFVGGLSSAGTKLKATSGWNSSGNGTDNFGFSALPGGEYYSGSFGNIGIRGFWRSTVESGSTGATRIYLTNNSTGANWEDHGKDLLHSVRCLMD